MPVKKVFLFIVSCLMFINTSFSQVSVGYKTGARDGESKFNPEDIAALKKTTTVFILPGDAEASDVKAYEKAFSDSWKYTPYKVVTDDQLKSLERGKSYSFLVLGGVDVTTSGGGHWPFCYYQLMMINGKKEKIFAQIKVASKYCFDKESKGQTPYNMLPGYLKYYLSVINSYLSEEKILKVGDNNKDLSMLKNLATETLYVPEESTHYISVWGGKEKSYKEEEFFQKYPYPHKLMSGKEINDLLFTSDKPVYFMGPVENFKGHMIISVYCSQSPDPVYYDVDENGGLGTLDPSLMKKIAGKVKKANNN